MNRIGILKILAVIVIGGSMLFATACGEGSDAAGSNRAMGRYVETEVKAPDGSYESLHLQADGSVNLLLSEPGTYKPAIYNTSDFENWSPVELAWQDQLAEGEFMESIAYDQKGQLFLLVKDYGGPDEEASLIPQIYGVSAEGAELTPIAVNWYESPTNSYYLYPNGFKVLENGDFLVLQRFDYSICQYGSDGSFKGLYEIDYSSDYLVSGNTIIILDGRSGSVKTYDGNSMALIDQMDFENYTSGSKIFYGQNEMIYIVNSSGLYRRVEGGGLWEKLIDGDMTSLTLPNQSIFGCMEMANGDFYLIGGSGLDDRKLLRYRFDPELVTVPEKELTIYALEENTVVRLAASIYQDLHPDTKITIEVADREKGVTQADLVRVLNTELLNGQGPDILVLDGLNVDAFIDKGILTDLTDLVNELTAERKMVEPVLRTYERDGRIHAMPVKFLVPVMIIAEEDVDSVRTLADLVRYAQERPEKGISGDMRAHTLFETLLPASAASWIENGEIDQGNLAEYLESLKALMDIDAPAYIYEEGYTYATDRTYQDQFHYAFGRIHTWLDNMAGMYLANIYHIDIEQRGEGVVTYMPGQQEKTFVPVTTVGINVNSREKEVACEFLKVLLSDEVQYDGGLTTGFAVSISAMEEEAAYYSDRGAGWAGPPPYVEGEYLHGPWAPVSFRQEIAQLAQGVLHPSILDETLKNMIQDASLGYLTGEKDLEQALRDVEAATKLYLAE